MAVAALMLLNQKRVESFIWEGKFGESPKPIYIQTHILRGREPGSQRARESETETHWTTGLEKRNQLFGPTNKALCSALKNISHFNSFFK